MVGITTASRQQQRSRIIVKDADGVFCGSMIACLCIIYMEDSHEDHTPLFLYNHPSFNMANQTTSFIDEDSTPNPPSPTRRSLRRHPKPSCRIHTRKIQRLHLRIKQLELQVCQLQTPESAEPVNVKPILIAKTTQIDPNSDCLVDLQQQQSAITDANIAPDLFGETPEGLEFERFEIAPLATPAPDEDELRLDGQSWMVMGMLMMVMGININGYDGSIDAYKITRETVDSIRKQVEKSSEEITFPVFYSKLFSMEGSLGMEAAALEGCFQLQGLRLQSISEQDLTFQEHMQFKLKYEALIVMMEYMKQYASLS